MVNFTPNELYHLNISKIISEWNDGEGTIHSKEAMKKLTDIDIEYLKNPQEKNKDSEQIKYLKRKLKERKLDIIQTLAENEEINHPQILIGVVWELRSIVKTLKWLNDEKETKIKYQNYT